MVEIARKSKFRGQLRSKLKKVKTHDLFAKEPRNINSSRISFYIGL
jgi:hypothetical protein